MAERVSRERWRSRVERFLESDMSVHEWCTANHVAVSAMFRHLGDFATREPELFGGPQNIVDRSQARWVTRTRENMRAATALSAPARDRTPSAFARVEEVPAIPSAERAWAVPERACAASAPITVAVNGAVVSIPPGFPPSDVRAVLKAVASL